LILCNLYLDYTKSCALVNPPNGILSAYQRALAAGANSLQEPENQFYGDRTAGVQDSFGNQWWFATHVEDVSPEDMLRRAVARASQPG
jgi:uncharacterized glyoxalase superfamily protein PhnB